MKTTFRPPDVTRRLTKHFPAAPNRDITRSMGTLAITILTIAVGLAFLVSAIRAALFANRHKDKLTGVDERVAWWIRLFMKNGYGPEAEDERRKLALQVLIPFALFFALAGAVQIMSMSRPF